MNCVKNINTYFETVASQISQSVINSVNYIFQVHAYNFPINTKISEETLVYDINAMGHFGITEFPVIHTIEAIENGNDLVLKISREYDKEFLLEQMKKKTPSIISQQKIFD